MHDMWSFGVGLLAMKARKRCFKMTNVFKKRNGA
jgi:hypothetical protein